MEELGVLIHDHDRADEWRCHHHCPLLQRRDNLGIVLEDAMKTLNELDFAQPYELIVVNDGSSDHSGQVADEYARRWRRRSRPFHHAINQGMGALPCARLHDSRGSYVTLIPADGEVKADQAAKLLLSPTGPISSPPPVLARRVSWP